MDGEQSNQTDSPVMRPNDKQKDWLFAYEKLAHVLVSGTTDPAVIYGDSSPVAEFFDKHPGARDGLWTSGHMYLALGFSPQQTAARWYVEVAAPLLEKMKEPCEKKKVCEVERERLSLISSFRLYPDDESSEVVGVELMKYARAGGPAVCIEFVDCSEQLISLYLPEHMGSLGKDEFYLYNRADMRATVELLVQRGVIAMVPDREPVKNGNVEVPVVRLVRSAFQP